MGKTRNGCLTTEQAAHPGSSPRTLECYRARDGGPPRVSCCNRVRGLRSGLEERVGGDERPVAVESEDDCRRDGRKSPSAKINLSS